MDASPDSFKTDEDDDGFDAVFEVDERLSDERSVRVNVSHSNDGHVVKTRVTR